MMTSLPSVIESYTNNTNRDHLDYWLSIGCAMAIGASREKNSSEEPSYRRLGSWTVLNSKTSNV